jgi:hypothetical protein
VFRRTEMTPRLAAAPKGEPIRNYIDRTGHSAPNGFYRGESDSLSPF